MLRRDVLRRECMLPSECQALVRAGRSTAPWYTRWLLWLANRFDELLTGGTQ